jgi:puromycin-sensitive aminopeptidase
MTEATGHRLPKSVDPRHYRLSLSLDLAAASFAGQEEIEVQVHEAVSEIELHAVELEVGQTRLRGRQGEVLEAKVRLEPADGLAVVELASPAAPGLWSLELGFSGRLNDKLRGLYRSTYQRDDGTQATIAASQFEPTDARRAFPCFDEPDRKATFSVTLEADEGLLAVSNGALVEAVPAGQGRVRHRFADTIPMSTYLVAMVVGPLEASGPVDVDGVALSVVHRPGKGELRPYALEVGAHALRFFSGWFAIDYPGTKLDLIALPDFAAGAMENLGAVTFREPLLLVDPKRASRAELERVADVICHEIAHMWFGDLVTMRWWNGLWLNEAFATYMEMLCVDAFRPEWERWVTFGRSRAAALATDGLSTTRPIEYPVGRPEEAEGMFDVLTYEKGAGVLRMLERYLGEDRFRLGIRLYLDRHEYANAETTDLWDAIEAATGEPVRSVMDSWIFQAGYPLVEAELAQGHLELRQSPFRYLADRPAPGGRWRVPLVVRRSAGGEVAEHRLLLDAETASLELGEADWVVANAGGWGFFRVAYSDRLARSLLEHLGELEPLERFCLASDTWATVLAGRLGLERFRELADRLGGERDPNVWSQMASALGLLDLVAEGDGRRALASYTCRLAGPALEAVGWERQPGEAETTGTLRATLVSTLGLVGADPQVRRRAAEAYASDIEGRQPIDPDLAPAVLAVVAAAGGPKEYEAFLSRYRSPATPQEEMRYLYGLAGFPQPELARRTLEMCLGEVRTQNAGYVVGAMLSNRHVGHLAWSFIKEHWDELAARLPDNTIPRMLEGVSSLCRRELAADVHAFLADHPVRAGQRMVDQARERLDVHVAFAEREGPRLAQVLG